MVRLNQHACRSGCLLGGGVGCRGKLEASAHEFI